MTKLAEEKQGTEQRIVNKALELFNRNGVEYVGMRELAEALDMRVGNITYYFPTKDHLVNRLSIDLAEENNRTIVSIDAVSMKGFFAMLEKVFQNHLKYRCLMLSFVHLMKRNPIISKRYEKIQSKRNEIWTTNVLALKKGKYLTTETQEQIDFLVSSIALIARFWISEAAISNKDESQQIPHYVHLIARIFLPYATVKGRKELQLMLNS